MIPTIWDILLFVMIVGIAYYLDKIRKEMEKKDD